MLNVDELSYKEFLDSKFMWNEVLKRSLDNNIFMTWEWLATWWKHYGSGRKFFCLIAKNNGDILSAVPLMISSFKIFGLNFKKLEFIGTPKSDYHTFLFSQGNQKFVKSLLNYAEQKQSWWDFLQLREIPADSGTMNMARLLQTQGGFQLNVASYCSTILLPPSFNEFFQSLSKKFRKELRSKERLLMKNHRVSFVTCSDKSEIPRAMKSFFDLHKKRWESKNSSSSLLVDPKAMGFYLDVASTFFENGWLALNFLTIDDEPVSAEFSFVYGTKYYFYLSGFDPKFLPYGIGHIHKKYVIKYLIERGFKELDLLRGASSYKMKFNPKIKINWTLSKSRPSNLPIILTRASNNALLQRLSSAVRKKIGEVAS